MKKKCFCGSLFIILSLILFVGCNSNDKNRSCEKKDCKNTENKHDVHPMQEDTQCDMEMNDEDSDDDTSLLLNEEESVSDNETADKEDSVSLNEDEELSSNEEDVKEEPLVFEIEKEDFLEDQIADATEENQEEEKSQE